MKKKFLVKKNCARFLALTMATALLFTGCGKAEKKEEQTTKETEKQTEESTEIQIDGEKVEVPLMKRVPAELEQEDGSHKAIKLIKLTDAGREIEIEED